MIHRACSFCGTQESDENPLIAGNGVYICKNCVVSAYKIMFGDDSASSSKSEELVDAVVSQRLDHFLTEVFGGNIIHPAGGQVGQHIVPDGLRQMAFAHTCLGH